MDSYPYNGKRLNEFEKANLLHTVKPEYNDHPRNPKIVTVVDRWSLFRGSFVI